MILPKTLDFETEAIGLRPDHYPPRPVGVAIDWGDERPAQYYSWGHPTGNNTTWERARSALAALWDSPLLFHNGMAFDIAVAAEYFDLPWPEIWDDTLILAYLHNPHAQTLSLKPLAKNLLGIPGVERDRLRDWILANVPGVKPSGWGAYIARAPGELVGEYAAMDVTMTRKLAEYLYPQVMEAGMEEAYLRERQLSPILWEAEKRGVRVDREALEYDLLYYEGVLELLDEQLRKLLNAPSLCIDEDDRLADALEKAGMIEQWVLTPTGRRSTSKHNLEAAMSPAAAPLRLRLRYRGALATCLRMFMRPWVQMSSATGRVYPTWNQVRGPEGGGTRTGRLSCTDPNLMNVSKEFDVELEDLPPLPLMRRYLLPEVGHVWGRRDFSQQELRILAHYEDGEMLEEYRRNPRVDFHVLAGNLIKSNTGIELPRKDVKTTAFSILYGSGSKAMAEKLGCAQSRAQELKDAYYQAIPGIRTLQRELKRRAYEHAPMMTWGQRRYFCEEPRELKDGKRQTYEYKMLNYLIQGSAADCTKQAVINYARTRKNGLFLVQVHDELNISVPPEYLTEEMKILSEAMADVAFDVPMLSDGSFGPNYQDLEDIDD